MAGTLVEVQTDPRCSIGFRPSVKRFHPNSEVQQGESISPEEEKTTGIAHIFNFLIFKFWVQGKLTDIVIRARVIGSWLMLTREKSSKV